MKAFKDTKDLQEGIVTFQNELESMQKEAQSRANDLLRPETARAYSQATVDAYSFVRIVLSNMLQHYAEREAVNEQQQQQ